MDRIVDIEIKGARVIGGGVDLGAAGSHDDVFLRITFDDKWEGLSKKAIWQNAYGNNTVYTLLSSTNNVYTVSVPAEAKEFEGKILFGVKGFLIGYRLTTAQPDDWAANYAHYYTKSGDIYTALTEATTWAENTFYEKYESKAVMSVRTEFVVLSSLSDKDAEAAQEPSAEVSEQLQAEIDDLDAAKVDKVSGKGLSTNDFTDTFKNKLDGIAEGAEVNVQSDWEQSDNTADDYIKNKPQNLVSDASYVHTDNNFTTEAKNKLDGIEAGAEVNDVTSVAGKTGAVTLVKGDVGLGNVDNTSDANKPISTATQTALNGKASTSDVTAIQGKIPAQASSSNQLADKNFVNSSIATETANYISNSGEPFTSVAQLEAYSGTVTNNDYAFVTGTDSDGNTYYDRYKASVSGSSITWAKEFRLNNSSFTAAQWSAISSGITATLVAQIGTNATAIAGKQDALTFDNSPTADSTNPVKSGGVYDALAEKYTKPQDGIPKNDLEVDVRETLGLADNSVQLNDEDYEKTLRNAYYGKDYGTVTDDDYLSFDASGGTIIVSGYVHEEQERYIIPYEHNGNMVGGIGDYAFDSNNTVEEIILPSTVTRIGNYAFLSCSHLTAVHIPKSVGTIGVQILEGTTAKVYCDKGSYAETYCETNNIPYVTDVDSEDLEGKQDTIVFNTAYNASTNKAATMADIPDVSGKQDKTDNNFNTTSKTVVGAVNEVNSLAKGKEAKWRLIQDITLEEEPSSAIKTFTTDTDNNSFVLSKAKIYIFSPASDQTRMARVEIRSTHHNGYDPSYAFVTVRDTNAHYAYIEMITDDNLPSHAIFADRRYSYPADSINMRIDFSSYTTHKQIEGIRVEMQDSTYRLAAGTRIVILGLDK